MAERIVLFGVTGSIGAAVCVALRDAGYHVVTPVRAGSKAPDMHGFETPIINNNLNEILQSANAVISCIASRSGTPKDSWAVDYHLNSNILAAAVQAKVKHFIMLSAICVQKPKLDFQQAKLKFETELQQAPLTWSIVRPTAFFKSLSGQLDRVRSGKPFLVFGDGQLTSCKPISDRDLADYIVGCLADTSRHNHILPVGGPGPAITPLDQLDMLEAAIGFRPKVRNVNPNLLIRISWVLGLIPFLKQKTALARIGHYYATESMLYWDGTAYVADQTPEYGSDTLAEHYKQLVGGVAQNERGSHAVF